MVTSTASSSIDPYTEAQHPLQAERWCNDYLNWIAETDISFEDATHSSLRKVIINGGPHTKDLIPTRNTVRSWLIATYKERLLDVKSSLANSRSRIVVSLDVWSSPNAVSLLGVVGHWMDEHCHLKTALLGLKPLHGHSGYAMAQVLSEVLTTYEIEGNISAFQMDNATSNDTTLDALLEELPSLNLTPLDLTEKRLRCFGHIINLVVKALLFGTNLSAFEKDLDRASDHEAFDLWRKQGAIGRLHNLVTYISRSDQRTRNFIAVQKALSPSKKALHLVKDIGVKWNSTYSMIKRALELQPAIQQYCQQWRPQSHEKYHIKSDRLDNEDWEELRHFDELLQHFDLVTKRVEGNANSGTHGALWEVIVSMDYLFTKLQKHSKEVTDDPDIFTDYYRHCLNHAFAKLSEYYTKIDESPFYAAAVALHPCKKFTYFEESWRKNKGGGEAIRQAKQSTRRLFNDYLKRQRQREDAATPLSPTDLFASNARSSEDPDWVKSFGDHTATLVNKNRRRQDNELQRFMDDDLNTIGTEWIQGRPLDFSYIDEPLRWWRDRGQATYPTLATLAFDLFAMPGMSSECERAFSAAKQMITDHRYSLKPDIIEAEQCIKSWIKHGVTNGSTTFTAAVTDAAHDAQATEIESIDIEDE